MRKTLTALAISAAVRDAKKNGKTIWLSDGSMPRGHGGLQLRVTQDGNGFWYWRYSVGSQKIRISLGHYAAEKTPACLTLPEARQAALDKAALYQKPESRDVREHMKREQLAHEARLAAETKAVLRAAREAEQAGKRTLLALMNTYQEHLETMGKQSAGDVRYLIKSHIQQAHPSLSAKPAHEISPEDINQILRPLVAAGKGRTAAKLRAYLRAAYSMAAGAKLDSSASQTLVDFDIQFNPAAQTGGLSKYNKALERNLTLQELRHYWKLLEGLPEGAMRDSLMLSLLLGGQRPAQLVRVTTADIDLSSSTITLRDPKGRRIQPRLHTLPMGGKTLEVVHNCLARAKRQNSNFLLSSYGKVPVRPEQLAKIVTTLSSKMLKDQIVTMGFQLRDIRRTAETLLAGHGVSQEVLARLLSHGLGGIQSRHYNKHTYALELKATLNRWEKLLMNQQQKTNVVPMLVGAA